MAEGPGEQHDPVSTQPLRQSFVRKSLSPPLPRETRTLSPAETTCPASSGELSPPGCDVSGQLELISSTFKIIGTQRPKPTCCSCAPPFRRRCRQNLSGATTQDPFVRKRFRSEQPALVPEVWRVKLDRYWVIVIDDLGYVKRDNAETGVLFGLIAHRYERGRLVITSNHPFSTWGSIFAEETMTVAAADRLIHHGYMFELKGESYRKRQQRQ